MGDALIFSSFLDIWENVEWPRFFGPPGIMDCKPQLQVTVTYHLHTWCVCVASWMWRCCRWGCSYSCRWWTTCIYHHISM